MSETGSGWRWWAKLGSVILAAVVAVLFILAGAVRFLDQAETQQGRVECLRRELQVMAQGGARMGEVVLNPANDLATRQAAFTAWSREQGLVADRLGRC